MVVIDRFHYIIALNSMAVELGWVNAVQGKSFDANTYSWCECPQEHLWYYNSRYIAAPYSTIPHTIHLIRRLNFGYTRIPRNTPILRPNGRAMGVSPELLVESRPWYIGSVMYLSHDPGVYMCFLNMTSSHSILIVSAQIEHYCKQNWDIGPPCKLIHICRAVRLNVTQHTKILRIWDYSLEIWPMI